MNVESATFGARVREADVPPIYVPAKGEQVSHAVIALRNERMVLEDVRRHLLQYSPSTEINDLLCANWRELRDVKDALSMLTGGSYARRMEAQG